jgi:predicted small secreted protein
MRKIKLLILISILINILLSSCNQKSTEGEWVQLFNGKDLTGWTPKIVGHEADDNFGNTFRVEDGLIKVRYDQYDLFKDRFGHLFYKDEFSHYKLRVEYRFQGDQLPDAPGWAYRNSGIMLHGQTPETMELDQDFPTSIEVQLLGCDSIAERTTMNLCTPGTNVIMNNQLILDHCTNSNSKFYFDDIWVTAEVEVRGNDVIYHILDGDTVLQYNQPQLDERDFTYKKLIELNNGDKMLSKGTISLQSEGHPVDFRKVEIMILE